MVIPYEIKKEWTTFIREYPDDDDSIETSNMIFNYESKKFLKKLSIKYNFNYNKLIKYYGIF